VVTLTHTSYNKKGGNIHPQGAERPKKGIKRAQKKESCCPSKGQSGVRLHQMATLARICQTVHLARLIFLLGLLDGASGLLKPWMLPTGLQNKIIDG